MSETDRITIASLHGGVSTQPPHVSFENQVTAADNIRFSIEDGASKRPPTEYVADIDFSGSFGGDSNPRLHGIERDENERYACIYGPNIAGTAFVLRVVDLVTGTVVTPSGLTGDVETYLETGLVGFTSGDYNHSTRTVTSTGAFANYVFRPGDVLSVYDWGTLTGSPTTGQFLIESRTDDDSIVLAAQSKQTETLPASTDTGQVDARIGESDQYKFVTVADTTIIVNSAAAVAMEDSPDYNVATSVPTYADLLAFTPDNDEYVRVETDDDTERAGYWQYTPEDDLEYATIAFTAVTGDWANGVRGEWDDGAMGFRISQARTELAGFTAATFTHTTRTLTKTGAFASYAYRPGDMIYITSWGTHAGSPTTGWFLIESRTSDNAIVLAPQTKQSGTLATDTVAGQVSANDDPDSGGSTCVIGQEVEVVVDFSTNKQSDMHEIAAEFQREMRSQGWANACVSWRPVTSGGFFQITSTFRGSTATLYSATSPATGPEDLTASGKPFNGGTITAGTGTLGASDELTQSPAYRWVRVAAPGQKKARFTRSSMPVKLTRSTTSPLAFALSTVDWDDRKIGDSNTNPAPSPFQNSDTTPAYIEDAVYFEGRFALASGEYLIFSEADNLFNLFLANDEQAVDSDRISRPVGTNKIANITYLVPYRRSLLILTASGQQYQLGYNTALTPSDNYINSTSSYRTADVRPSVMGSFVYLVSEKDDGSAVWEYFYDEGSGSYLANEITKHVAGYVPTGLRALAGDSVQEALVCGSIDARDLYVYRTHWNGGTKVLAAWSRYRFDSTYDIQDVVTLGGDIYILTYISGDWMLERIPLTEPDTPADFDYLPHMDRLRRIPAADLSLDSGNTVIDLQGTGASSSTYNAYLLQDGTYVTASDAGQSWAYATGGLANDEMKVDGDITGNDIYLGRYYTSSITLTRPYRRDQQGKPSLGERLNIKTAWIEHRDTGKYMVKRSHDSGNWSDAATIYTPSSTTGSGWIRIPVRADADDEVITITDAVHTATASSFSSKPAVATPMNITGVEYEVEATQGMRRN